MPYREIYAAYHWEFGRHSCIPECCIEHFVEYSGYVEAWKHYVRDDWDTPASYVRCPRCRATDRVLEIHTCVRGCAWWDRLDPQTRWWREYYALFEVSHG